MANYCNNKLSVWGKEAEINRFLSNTIKERKEFFRERARCINVARQRKRSCQVEYETRNDPFLKELLGCFSDYPKLHFNLYYTEPYGGFQGKIKTKGEKIKKQWEKNYHIRKYAHWIYKILRVLRPGKYPFVIELPVK